MSTPPRPTARASGGNKRPLDDADNGEGVLTAAAETLPSSSAPTSAPLTAVNLAAMAAATTLSNGAGAGAGRSSDGYSGFRPPSMPAMAGASANSISSISPPTAAQRGRGAPTAAAGSTNAPAAARRGAPVGAAGSMGAPAAAWGGSSAPAAAAGGAPAFGLSTPARPQRQHPPSPPSSAGAGIPSMSAGMLIDALGHAKLDFKIRRILQHLALIDGHTDHDAARRRATCLKGCAPDIYKALSGNTGLPEDVKKHFEHLVVQAEEDSSDQEADDDDMSVVSDAPPAQQANPMSMTPLIAALPPPAPAVNQDAVEARTQELLTSIPEVTRRQCNFDHRAFVRRLVEILMAPNAAVGGAAAAGNAFIAHTVEELVAGGLTQSGKTAFKAVVLIVCSSFRVATIIVTKGNSERNSLWRKICRYVEGTDVRKDILLISQGRDTERKLERCIFNGGGIVLNCTGYQMMKAHNLLISVRGRYGRVTFNIIADEADSFYRTHDRSLKLEQAYNQLAGLNTHSLHGGQPCLPVFRLQISATLVPVFMMIKENGLTMPGNNLFFTIPTADYNAVENMEALRDGQNRPLFLKPRELKTKNLYMSDSTARLYADAAQKPRSLLLDISCPRVRAAHNIFEKALEVQAKHPTVCVIAICGKGIDVHRPGADDWDTHPKHLTIGQVIQIVDNDPTVGLEVPIFIFGFSRMQRGDSFRSDRRVPTHTLVALGPSQCIEQLLQALGRATFNGRGVLAANGFPHVTALVPANDWDSAQSYPRFQQELRQRLTQGESLADLLDGTSATFGHASDFISGSNRPVGAKRLKLEPRMGFERAPGARQGAAFAARQIDSNPILSVVLAAIRGVIADTEGGNPNSASAGDAECTFTDLLDRDLCGMSEKVVHNALIDLKDLGFIRRRRDDSDNQSRARNKDWLYALNRG